MIFKRQPNRGCTNQSIHAICIPEHFFVTGRFGLLGAALIFVVLCTFGARTGYAQQPMPPKSNVTTHLLAISICPPWKNIPAGVCARDIALMKERAQTLGVAAADVTTLLNEEATYTPVKEAFSAYGTLGSQDRLVIYLNLHNGAEGADTKASASNDMMVLYSKEDPKIIEFALAEKHWIEASELAGWVHQIPAGEVVVIVDACESSAIDPLFVRNHPANDKTRREAVLSSAQPGQIAKLTANHTNALFTHNLGQALHSSSKKGETLAHASQVAVGNTAIQGVLICATVIASEPSSHIGTAICNQEPQLDDPDDLFSRIALVSGE